MNRKIKMRSGYGRTAAHINEPERFDHHRESLACVRLRGRGTWRSGERGTCRCGRVIGGWFLH